MSNKLVARLLFFITTVFEFYSATVPSHCIAHSQVRWRPCS